MNRLTRPRSIDDAWFAEQFEKTDSGTGPPEARPEREWRTDVRRAPRVASAEMRRVEAPAREASWSAEVEREYPRMPEKPAYEPGYVQLDPRSYYGPFEVEVPDYEPDMPLHRSRFKAPDWFGLPKKKFTDRLK
jgi:hypothetical protein